MHPSRILAASVFLAACASAATFPRVADQYSAINNADLAIADAQGAGADSLASAEMAVARADLDAARQLARTDPARAALRAQEAAADAMYAKAAGRRNVAQRQRDNAAAALAALPQGGNQ